MKKLNEIPLESIKNYTRNLEEILELEIEIKDIESRINFLKSQNEQIEKNGKIEQFCSDDIPF